MLSQSETLRQKFISSSLLVYFHETLIQKQFLSFIVSMIVILDLAEIILE